MRQSKEILSKIKNNKKDILLIILLFLFSLVFLKNTLGTETLMNNVHYYHEQTLFSYNYKTALEDNTLPFWTPYWYSGQPFYGDSQVFFLNLTFIFILLFKNIFLAINLSTLFYFFISGLSMYLLVKYLLGSRGAAFISAVIYMFNGLIYGFVVSGNPSILEPYSLMPLIFLFVVKAKKSKYPVRYSIFAGMLFTLQIFSGGALMLIYTFLLIGAYLALDLISVKFKINLTKTLIIGLVLLSVSFGLSAVKLLPNFDFVKKTNRAQGLSYQEYIGADYFVFKDSFNTIVLNKKSSGIKAHIGIAAAILMLLSLGLWRKRIITYLILTSIFIMFLASGGFLAELFYKYVPTFSQTRHIGRVMFVFVFAASVLAGYGFHNIKTYVRKKFHISGKIIGIVTVLIIGLILTELVFLKGLPTGFNIQKQLEENHLANFLEQQKDKFRVAVFDIDDLIAFHGSSYYAHYGLETISGGGPLWINDFIRYLGVAKNYNNSKLLGILNLKYFISSKKTDIDGFKLVKRFEDCNSCNTGNNIDWIDGPYLYENKNFIPRYLLVKNSILVVGNGKQAQEFIYGILLNKNFDPKTTVILQESISNLDKYSSNELLKFNTILILSSPTQNTMIKLKEYVNKGGKLIPDIFKNENSISQETLITALKGKSYKTVIVKEYSTNKIFLELNGEKGWLMLSERFADFPGWKVSINGKQIKIYKADNVISAVYLESEKGELKFEYKPQSFSKGLIITIATIFILLVYFVYSKRNQQR